MFYADPLGHRRHCMDNSHVCLPLLCTPLVSPLSLRSLPKGNRISCFRGFFGFWVGGWFGLGWVGPPDRLLSPPPLDKYMPGPVPLQCLAWPYTCVHKYRAKLYVAVHEKRPSGMQPYAYGCNHGSAGAKEQAYNI